MDGHHQLIGHVRRGPRPGPTVAALLLAVVPLAFLGVFFLLPLGGMLTRGFVPDGQLDLGAVGDVLGRSRTARVVGFTLGISTLATAVTLGLGLPTAFALHRLAIPGADALRALVIRPFVMHKKRRTVS